MDAVVIGSIAAVAISIIIFAFITVKVIGLINKGPDDGKE